MKALKGFFNKLISHYQAISKINSLTPGLRLISYQRDLSSGEVRFVVQVTGKNIFPELLLRDLEEASLLANFGDKDQQIIRHFLIKESGQPEMRIIARTYDRAKKQFVFTIESLNQNRKMTVDNLSPFVRNNIHKFDKEDSAILELEAGNAAN